MFISINTHRSFIILTRWSPIITESNWMVLMRTSRSPIIPWPALMILMRTSGSSIISRFYVMVDEMVSYFNKVSTACLGRWYVVDIWSYSLLVLIISSLSYFLIISWRSRIRYYWLSPTRGEGESGDLDGYLSRLIIEDRDFEILDGLNASFYEFRSYFTIKEWASRIL